MGKPDALLRRPDHGKGTSNNEDVVLLRLELIVVRALEGLHLEGSERDMLREIRQGNQKGNQEEPVAKAARELQQTSSKTVRSAEWSEGDRVLWFRGKIYVPWNSDLWRRIVSLCHDTKVARHPRCWKTLELVSRNYWWPQMSRYIGQYVSTCDLCLRTKPIRQAPVGKLHSLWILDSRWDTLSVDFVVERRIRPMAYCLRLPHGMKQLHPVFNVVKLTPALDDLITGRKIEDHPLPIVIDGEPEWKVEKILDSRWHWRRFQYLIKWKGYSCEYNSWESTSEVSIPELTAEFHHKHPGAPRHVRRVEFNNIFYSKSIAPRRSNLEGGVNVRGHLHFYP